MSSGNWNFIFYKDWLQNYFSSWKWKIPKSKVWFQEGNCPPNLKISILSINIILALVCHWLKFFEWPNQECLWSCKLISQSVHSDVFEMGFKCHCKIHDIPVINQVLRESNLRVQVRRMNIQSERYF